MNGTRIIFCLALLTNGVFLQYVCYFLFYLNLKFIETNDKIFITIIMYKHF